MLRGFLYLLSASFLFALSTVTLKLAVGAPYFVPVSVAIFARFFAAFVIFAAAAAALRESLRPNNPGIVAARAVLNTAAVVLFFAGVAHTTVTKANILNLTYPVFVFLVAPSITGERARPRHVFSLALVLAGAWLIVMPRPLASGGVNRGDLLALASGVVAGFAIAVLRQARKQERSHVILFHQMAFGSVVSAALLLPSFAMPRGAGLLLVIATALLSAAGQYLLTVGYRCISASLGSIVLGSGVLFGALLGIGVLGDPLTPAIAAGGALIVAALAGVSGLFDRDRNPSACAG